MKRMNPRWKASPMWPSGVGSRQPNPRDSALRRAAISGNVLALPPFHVPTGRAVRVFICANPDDTEAERNALKEHVYPKLRDFCRENYGVEFQVVDLYWGVDPEEWDSPDLQRLRMKLLEDCLKTSAGPCFVGLVGEKYGSIRVPGEVESAEFEMILDAAVEAGLDTRLLEEWYCRDENAVPPAYYLKPKAQMLKNYQNSVRDPDTSSYVCFPTCLPSGMESSSAAKSKNDKAWRGVSDEIKKIFRTAVLQLQEKGTMKSVQAKKFLCSPLEDELDFALGKQTPAFLKKCVCYIRKIANFDRHAKLPEMARYMDIITDADRVMRNQEAYERLLKVRDEFIPTVVAASNLRVYSSVTHCDMKLGYSQEVESHYVEGLCKQFYEDMVDIIQATVQQNFDAETDPMYDELLQHLSLCKTFSSIYEYKSEALDLVQEYLYPVKGSRMSPLVVYGGPCSGKTLLLAEVAKEAYSWLQKEMGPETDPVVIVRFIGTTDFSTDLRTLLQSICEQIAINYRCLIHFLPQKIQEMRELLVNLLGESSFHRPLVIVLDALEQLSDADEARKLWWLPAHLPRTVRIVVSTLPNKHGILQKLRSLVHDEFRYVELIQRDRKACSQTLKQQLLSVKRKVTSGQQIYVNEALAKCTLPMFVNLIYREVVNWRSHKDVDDTSLSATVHDSIERLFFSVEDKLGSRFVFRALGYITMSKAGLTEMELEDILSLDNSVLGDIMVSSNLKNPLRVSYDLIARLREELDGYLIERQVRNVTLMVWANRHLHLIALKLYLSNEEDVHQMHSLLAEYFLGAWAGGRKKIFHCDNNHFAHFSHHNNPQQQQQQQQHHHHHPSQHGHDKGSADKYSYDRQTPEQPWVFQCNLLEPDIFFVNHRKMTELVYHLTRSGRTDDLMYGVIMNFSWLYTMIKIGHFDKALTDIDLAYSYSQEKELKFLATTLRSIKVKVTRNPASLSAELQQRLLPVVTSLPKLRHLLLECDKDGPKYCSIVPLHSSMDVTYSPERLPLCSSYMQIVEIIPTLAPSIVIVALEDGSVSTWDVESRQLLRQIDTARSVVLGIRLTTDEKYLVVATTKNTLLIYDNHKSCLLSEVEVKCSKHLGVTGGVAFINGFTLSSQHALAWLEASKEVNVIDLVYGWPLYQFHCWYEVTCVQCSPDGMYAFCGQYLNTTSIFHLGSGDKLATMTSEFSGGFVKSILVLDTLNQMVMIDNEGSLSVWNTKEVTNPRLMEDYDCRGDDSEVVGIELSEDQRSILICKARSIEVLDTKVWKMVEKFKAKRTERFVAAVLSKNGQSIVASMENTSSIFVWRRDSGQCMASLIEISGAIVKLIKSTHHNLLLSVASSGVLSVWDIDIITAMSNIDKTGKRILNLQLSGREDFIYTMDGSESIHKWNFNTGFIEMVFKHEGLVENCVLTTSGDLMVTSDDKSSQYIWQTTTGENIFRINGQKITQLLITHNDQFVVSLCEQNASRVWRLATGHKVCNILVTLQHALITTANTFLVGTTKNKLLAVSLWSGSVSKKFICDDGITIVNFKLIPDCPDYVVFITSTETVFIWSVADESVCRRVQMPANFLKNLEDFQISPNGKLGIVSKGDENINVLDLHSGKLRLVHAAGIIWRQKLSRDGRYLVYICFRNCEEDDDAGVVSNLIVMRLADGKSIGTCSLYKTPTFLCLSQRALNIIVGFEDGSIGTYTVVDRVDAALKIKIATSNSRQIVNNAAQKVRPKCSTHAFKTISDCIWRESTEVFSRDSPINLSDSGEAETTTPTKKSELLQ
ncbi:NACHT and WD repeat domain-containing protein 2 isoform X1 [Alosa sapidissima]|uniref:NACHT and WD repeat domain-containing protein 2 isoform X1 n=2 Tax=Alosa sapidissima TaxID=34773 RepID=UPI001C087425|nr:NACHT and WD repeat domain-containing protein 2 isoform X1 [Alosa sapidissima]